MRDRPFQRGHQLRHLLGQGRTALAITAGAEHTCALLDDKSVKCWGLNANGQLGQGDTNDRGDAAFEMGNLLRPVEFGTSRGGIESGWYHTCASGGARFECWGANGSGQLASGDTVVRGDGANEMRFLWRVDFTTLGYVHSNQVSVGGDFGCGVLTNRTLKCWGENGDGQLGLGDTNDRGDGSGEMGDALPLVELALH